MLIVNETKTGHIYYGTRYGEEAGCDDCGTCDGAKCEQCRSMYRIYNEEELIYIGSNSLIASRLESMSDTIEKINYQRYYFEISINDNDNFIIIKKLLKDGQNINEGLYPCVYMMIFASEETAKHYIINASNKEGIING